jgi:hypothetical protein
MIESVPLVKHALLHFFSIALAFTSEVVRRARSFRAIPDYCRPQQRHQDAERERSCPLLSRRIFISPPYELVI